MAAQTVEPCPFCGCKTEIDKDFGRGHPVGIITAIECPRCGALGPKSGSVHGALKAWNEREIQFDMPRIREPKT